METKPTIFSPGFLEHPRTSEQAGRKKLRFSYGDDLVLLKEVIALNPFEKNQRWEDVRSNVCFLTGKSFSTRSCREHTELLIKLLRKSDTNNLRKGSPEQQFEEKMRLLQQVFDMSEEYATKKSKPSPNTTPVHPPTHLVRLHPKQENAPKYVDSQGTTFVLDGSATFASNGLVAEDTEMSSIVDEDCNSAGSAGNSPVEDFTSSHEENAAHESQHGEVNKSEGTGKIDARRGKKARLRLTAHRKKRRIPTELLLWRQKSQIIQFLAKQHELGEPSTSASTATSVPPLTAKRVAQQRKAHQKGKTVPPTSNTDTTVVNNVQLEIPELLEVNIKEEPEESISRDGSSFEMVTLPGCSAWNLPDTEQLPPEESVKEEVPQPPEKICRLCMSTEELIGLYDAESMLQELPTKITDVSAITVYEGDGLPQHICHTCISSVNKFFDFKVQCSVTNVTLKVEQQKTSAVASKKKSDLTEFQKLNKRLKAALQNFYDLVDAINELQDKAQCEVVISSASIQRTTLCNKRKAIPLSPEVGTKHIRSSTRLPPIETGASQMPSTQIQSLQTTPLKVFDMPNTNNISSDLPAGVKSEPEPDSEPETEFVTSAACDFVHTKFETEEHDMYNRALSADLSDSLPTTTQISDFQQSNVCVSSNQKLSNSSGDRNFTSDSLSTDNVM